MGILRHDLYAALNNCCPWKLLPPDWGSSGADCSADWMTLWSRPTWRPNTQQGIIDTSQLHSSATTVAQWGRCIYRPAADLSLAGTRRLLVQMSGPAVESWAEKGDAARQWKEETICFSLKKHVLGLQDYMQSLTQIRLREWHPGRPNQSQ